MTYGSKSQMHVYWWMGLDCLRTAATVGRSVRSSWTSCTCTKWPSPWASPPGATLHRPLPSLTPELEVAQLSSLCLHQWEPLFGERSHCPDWSRQRRLLTVPPSHHLQLIVQMRWEGKIPSWQRWHWQRWSDMPGEGWGGRSVSTDADDF